MKRRCSPRFVKTRHLKTQSWRKAACELNEIYSVTLSHLAWRDYATGRRDITNPATRAALMLGPRACPTCGQKPGMQLSRLLKRMAIKDLRKWNRLREGRQYKAAKSYLEEVYNRKIKR